MKKSSLSSEIETLKVEQISEKSQSDPGFSPDLGAVEPKVVQNEKKVCPGFLEHQSKLSKTVQKLSYIHNFQQPKVFIFSENL